MNASIPYPGAFLLPISLLVITAGCGSEGPRPRIWGDSPPPNVLFLSIDTLRADHLGFYGYARPTSPHLDAFAEEAVVFDAAQASASWTLPGLASLLTSQYTSTHQCLDLGSRLSESFTTFTEHVLAAGYDTACVTSHVFTTTRHGLQQGFVQFDDSYAYPAVDPEDVIPLIDEYPEHYYGVARINPYERMKGVAEIEYLVKNHNFKGAFFHPYGFGTALNAREVWPFYAKHPIVWK